MAKGPTNFTIAVDSLATADHSDDPSLEGIRAECIARVLGTALERDFFNMRELAHQADVELHVTKRILTTFREDFEEVFAPRYLLRGEWLVGLRVRSNRKHLVRWKIRQLVPNTLRWLNPIARPATDPIYLESLNSAAANLLLLRDACSNEAREADYIVSLWEGVVADLEICRQEVIDDIADGTRPASDFSNRMLEILADLDQLTEQYELVARVFQGSGSPRRRLSRLEFAINSFTAEGTPDNLSDLNKEFRTFDLEEHTLRKRSSERLLVKRAFDICFTSIALVLLAPLLFAIAVLIKLDSPGPILFQQSRRGLGGRVFRIWKFRTMFVYEDSSIMRQATRHDARVTRLGRQIRRLSLDELPQLINVLRGDMSLVGPRPHSLARDDSFEQLVEGYSNRYLFRPGLTGYAQVNGHRAESSDAGALRRRHQYDLYYMKNWSLWFDIKIIASTIFTSTSQRNSF